MAQMVYFPVMEAKESLSFIGNTMAADNLAMQGAKASAVIVLAWFAWIFRFQHCKG